METHRYLSFVPENLSSVAGFISNAAPEINIPGTWFQFVIILKDTHQLIGDIGIHFLKTEPQNKQVEIGYTICRSQKGNGFATEALVELINYLFNTLNKHRISASVDPKNNPSIQLIERLGFRKEAHFKKSLYFKGEWVDDVIYAMLAEEWISSPWSKMDPDMKVEISGNDGEKGDTYYWKGNDKVGEGTMEITDINENKIDILLTFKEPFEAESPISYKLTDENGKTNVSWSMKGSMSYPWNFFMLFMDMEEAIGKDFENGLENLKKELK